MPAIAELGIWNPVTCFAACAAVYVIGEWLSRLCKGNISSLMFASAIFLLGFWFNIFPDNVTTAPGLAAAMSNFGVGLLIVNLGTLIDLEDMIKEWKTVVVSLLGMIGVVIGAFTLGALLFGREWALTAVPATAGGTIAVLLVQNAANAVGRPEVAAFAILVMSFRKFIGMPIATLGMKKELTSKIARGDFAAGTVSTGKALKLPDIRIFKPTSPAGNTNNMKLFKLAIVATIANLVGLATQIPGADAGNYFLNPNISYLIFGLLFTRLGFLEKATLQKADSYGLMMLGLMLQLPGSLAKVEPWDVVEMIVPLAGLLVIYSLATCVIAIIIGKLVGYSPAVSCAVACTSMIGYPGTEILSNEVCSSLDCDEETRAKALEYIMPKMIVGGFTTVTIASVALAGVLAPMIFG